MDKPLDPDGSVQLGQRIQAKAKQPFENSYRAVLSTADALYVQGFLVINRHPFQPLEHAWLELPDQLLDPNFTRLNSKPDHLFYFPAHTLTRKQVKAAVEEAKEDYPDDPPLPIYGEMPYTYYGDVMLGGQPYTDALAAAEAQAQKLQTLWSQRSEDN